MCNCNETNKTMCTAMHAANSGILRVEYVLVFDGNQTMCIDKRTAMSHEGNVLNPGVEVYKPPSPSPGIMNLGERKKLLDMYAKNPIVVDIDTDDSKVDCEASRHFMCFGFSSTMPYFIPGTMIRSAKDTKVPLARLTGTIVGYGQRNNEYALLISFDVPVQLKHASALLPGFRIDEVEDDESACR